MASWHHKIFLVIGATLMSFASHAADEWHDISLASPITSTVRENVNCATDGSNGMFATWAENVTQDFKAAHYDGVTQLWADITPSSPDFGTVNFDVICVADGNNGIFATWGDNTHAFKAAHYDGLSWIDITSTSPNLGFVYYVVNCVADSSSGLFATWEDYDTFAFKAAYYDGLNWHDITPTSPDLGIVAANVSCATDGSNGIFATWGDGFTQAFKAAYYNGVSWFDITPISPELDIVNFDVSCTADGSGGIFATWRNGSIAFKAAHYDGVTQSWTDITPTSPDLGDVQNNVNCVADGSNGMFATWGKSFTGAFKAAHYDGITQSWTDISPSSPDLDNVYFDVDCCFNFQNHFLFATWANALQNFRAAFYGQVIPPRPVRLNLKGFQKKNNFAVVSEQFNALFWKRPSNQVVSYVLKRNGQVIEILKGSATSYEDHNRKKSVADTYLLTARDAHGQTIVTDTITIKGK